MQRPSDQPGDFERIEAQLDLVLEDELKQPVVAPDMSRAIMGRLGYMRVSGIALRQRNRAKWTRRLGTAACLGLALYAGIMMHQRSRDSRLPTGPTIPAALRDSLESSGAEFHRAIESINLFNILHEQGAEFLERQDQAPRNDADRPNRSNLQRGNQPPFRWVRGMSHDRSFVV